MLLAMHRIGRRGAQRTPIEERFWEKVERTEGCWLWTGTVNRKGYGSFWNGEYRVGLPTGRPVMVGAHLWAYEHFVGPRDDLSVLHRCDVPACVNYERCLFLGTKGDNNRDRAAKGRSALGERHPKAILTEAQAVEILTRYRAGGASQHQLAREYGVSRSSICSLLAGRNWKHLHHQSSGSS